MKKIINNKVYDTDKATLLGTDGGGDGFSRWHEELYQKRTGEFFLYGEGGPMTRYAVSRGQNSWGSGERIIPMSMESARKWAEDHLDADAYEEIFGLPDEDAEPVAIHMLLPAKLTAAAKQRAIEDNTTMVSVVESALTEYLHT